MEREQKGNSKSARIAPPKQVPHSREQNIAKSEEKREIQIAPPIEWVPQKGIYKLHPEDPNFDAQRDDLADNSNC